MKKIFIFILLCYHAPLLQAQTLNEVTDLIRQGRMHQAKSVLLQLENKRKIKSPSDTLLFLHGLLAEDGTTASTYYQQLIQTFPQSTFSDNALFRMAQFKYAKGLYRTAKKQFSTLSVLYPESSLLQQAKYWIGLCFQAIGNEDSAAIFYQDIAHSGTDDAISELASKGITELSRTKEAKRTASQEQASRKYFVQVGAFSEQIRAIHYKTFYEREGFQVALRSKTRNGQDLYLVWVGSGSSRTDAEKLGEKIKKKYLVQYLLVYE
jgi:hypothetical protein